METSVRNYQSNTETHVIQSSPDGHSTSQGQLASRVSQLTVSQHSAGYRRNQVSAASQTLSVRLESAGNYPGIHSLSSFPRVDATIFRSERSQFSDTMSVMNRLTLPTPAGEHFVSVERNYFWPYMPMFNGNEWHSMYAFHCDPFYANSFYNPPLYPIFHSASEFESNREFAHVPPYYGYSYPTNNPINPPDVGDLWYGQLSYPLIHQQAAPTWDGMHYGPPISSYVMRTERCQYRIYSPYADPRSLSNHASHESFASVTERRYTLENPGTMPRTMNSDARNVLVEHEESPFTPNSTILNNEIDHSRRTLGMASHNTNMTIEREVEEDNAGSQGNLPYTWL